MFGALSNQLIPSSHPGGPHHQNFMGFFRTAGDLGTYVLGFHVNSERLYLFISWVRRGYEEDMVRSKQEEASGS